LPPALQIVAAAKEVSHPDNLGSIIARPQNCGRLSRAALTAHHWLRYGPMP
jgi:hypothetical protein